MAIALVTPHAVKKWLVASSILRCGASQQAEIIRTAAYLGFAMGQVAFDEGGIVAAWDATGKRLRPTTYFRRALHFLAPAIARIVNIAPPVRIVRRVPRRRRRARRVSRPRQTGPPSAEPPPAADAPRPRGAS